MSEQEARQVVNLLNSENQLTKKYTVETILSNKNDFLLIKNNDGTITAVAELSKVQWYQGEIKHVSVKNEFKKKGLGTTIVKKAEKLAQKRNCRILQCTIRENNYPSIILFTKLGYKKTCSFFNVVSSNNVIVFQKVISPIK